MPITRETVIRIEPRTSSPSRTPRPWFSLIKIPPRMNVTIPMGTLMTKIQCQFTAWVKMPPTSRPMDPPPTATNMYALMALARSLAPENSVTMIATMTEVEMAPPMP